MAAEKKQFQVSVNKESSEVFEAVGGLAESIIVKARGGLTLQEIVEAVTVNISKVIAASEGMEKIGAEFQEAPEDSLLPAFLMGQQVAKALRAPAPAPVV